MATELKDRPGRGRVITGPALYDPGPMYYTDAMADSSGQQKTPSLLNVSLKGILTIVLMAVVIFLCAGRIDYWQGWAFSAAMLFIMAFSLITFTKSGREGLMKERTQQGPGAKGWDRVMVALIVISYFGTVIVGSLDSGRFLLSPPLPWYMYATAYTVFAASVALQYWAMWVNTFFSTVVRIQRDRGQVVVQEGPYHFVRHPGYTSGIFLVPSNALTFGSLWALVPAGLMVLVLVIRTSLEDATLQRELAGYADYAKKVRYRLIPGIW